MDTFEITFSVKNIVYMATVKQTGPLYLVKLQDQLIAEIVGEMVLELQSDGNFLFKMNNSLQMDFLIAVTAALKNHFQDGMVRPALW